jgi:hypothetical protein
MEKQVLAKHKQFVCLNGSKVDIAGIRHSLAPPYYTQVLRDPRNFLRAFLLKSSPAVKQ